MKIDLGHDRWALTIARSDDKSVETHEPINIQSLQADKFDRGAYYRETTLEARRIEDGVLIGKIGLLEFKLTEQGFDASGIGYGAIDGRGVSPDVLTRTWKATRLYDSEE